MATVEHVMLSKFRSGIGTVNKDVKDLIDVKNNILYLLDESSNCILVANSTSLTGSFDIPEQRYQVFDPRIKIHGQARALRASEHNIRVAVLTEMGLYVVELPHIWTTLLLPVSQSNHTECEVWMVAPEVEKMHIGFLYEVLQARWHPQQHNYLLALYNDNFLRLLDTETRTLIRALSLGRHPTSRFSTLIPLRENVVDFDLDPRTQKSDEALVVLLTGTGDVSSALISKDKGQLENPVSFKMGQTSQTKMTATSSACSLIVLPSIPTFVIISYTTGEILHGSLLGEGSSQFLKVFEEYNIVDEETKTKGETYLLLKDQATNYRYFVLHAAGVHAVMIPLIPLLDHILAQELTENHQEMLQRAVRNTKSVVRPLVNPQVAEDPNCCPMFGIGVIVMLMTTTKLLTLLANGQGVVYGVDSLFPLVADFLNKFCSEKGPRKPFSVVINNYLSTNTGLKPPVIVKNVLKLAPPEAHLEFLKIYKRIVKQSHIMKHTVVAELIDAKTRDNAIEYRCQLKQLEILHSERDQLQQNAERIAEQYEEMNEKQIQLQKRLEIVGLRMKAPGISVPESKMKAELLVLTEKFDKLKRVLQQTQSMIEHRRTQELQGPSQSVQRPRIYLNEYRRTVLRQALQATSEDIRAVKTTILDLIAELNVPK